MLLDNTMLLVHLVSNYSAEGTAAFISHFRFDVAAGVLHCVLQFYMEVVRLLTALGSVSCWRGATESVCCCQKVYF